MNPMDLTNKDVLQDPGVRLMLAYQAGDESAFDRIVGRYAGQVFALLTRFLGSAPGREDLAQDVFVRVIRARARYQPTARFSTWLYRIVFNLCVNEKERMARRSIIATESSRIVDDAGLASFADPDVPDPTAGLEQADIVTAVREAIAALPPAQRMALVLSKYDDLSYAEVALAMGSTEKAIKSMAHRARENLRARLHPFLSEELL